MLPTTRTNRAVSRSFIDDFFNDNFFSGFTNSRIENKNVPAVNVEETDKGFIIDVAAPGLDKKDFHLSVEKNTLTISSKKEENQEENQEGILRREFNLNIFSRSFTLPEDTEVDKIKASHKNGILSVNIPKVEVKVQKAKEIAIS